MTPPRMALTVAGLVVLALAAGPLETLGVTGLTGHMVQHVLLTTVAPPLLVLGVPAPMLLRGLPDGPRRHLTRWWRTGARTVSGVRWPAWTAAAVVVHLAAVVGWHVPVAYEAAVGSPALHLVEHGTFLSTALLFWWTVAGAGRPARHGSAVAVLFVASLPATALGAAMALSDRPWYPTYVRSSVEAAVTDQQLAGVVMWSGAGTATVAAAVVLFAGWLLRLERQAPG